LRRYPAAGSCKYSSRGDGRANSMGARDADYVLLRLPLEVRELFAEWPRAHYPGKLKHVRH
jgi:hypothetical protein